MANIEETSDIGIFDLLEPDYWGMMHYPDVTERAHHPLCSPQGIHRPSDDSVTKISHNLGRSLEHLIFQVPKEKEITWC